MTLPTSENRSRFAIHNLGTIRARSEKQSDDFRTPTLGCSHQGGCAASIDFADVGACSE